MQCLAFYADGSMKVPVGVGFRACYPKRHVNKAIGLHIK